jgi:RHS repeat-associated protein
MAGDLVGSTRLITSSTGSVVGVNTYSEYGTLTSSTGTASSVIGYSGNWTDPDTGLVYLRARDYDPATAQFLTVDPLVDQTRQPYAYVADNPLTQTDPSGCDFWNDLLNNVAVGLMHGPGADVASVLEGTGDGASFGLTDQVRQLMGTDCEVQKNGFYFAGLIGGAIASTVVTAGIGSEGDIADAGKPPEISGVGVQVKVARALSLRPPSREALPVEAVGAPATRRRSAKVVGLTARQYSLATENTGRFPAAPPSLRGPRLTFIARKMGDWRMQWDKTSSRVWLSLRLLPLALENLSRTTL